MSRSRDLASRIVKTATGGVLTLRSSDTTITDGSVLGKLEFNAPDEGSGTDALLVGAAIHAVAEGTFTASSNASELVFMTGSSEAASSKMVLSSGGNLSVAGTLTPTGVLTANAGVVVDNITIDGSAITAGASNDFTIDAVGDIILDADGADIKFKDGGTEFGKIQQASNNLRIYSSISDADIEIIGNDGGSNVTALRFDMSTQGTAYFNHDVKLTDNHALRLGTDSDIIVYHDNSNAYLQNTTGDLTIDVAGTIKLDADSGSIYFQDAGSIFGIVEKSGNNMSVRSGIENGDLAFKGNDGGSIITALTLDMSEAGNAIFNQHAYFPDNGYVVLGAGEDIKIHSDGTHGTIATQNGNLTVDAAGDIILDADGSDITLKDGGTEIGNISLASSNLMLTSSVQDKDIIFTGNDGGSAITALTLDMSDGGVAFFGNDIRLNDNRAARFGNDQDFRIYNDGSASYLVNSTLNHDMLFIGNDDGSSITALTLDMSNAGKATFTGIVNSAMGFERGDMFITANEIDVSSGDLLLDVAGDIILDAGGAEVKLKDDGTQFGQIYQSSSNLYIQSSISNKDLKFEVNDAGAITTALTLDGGAAGAATFNSSVTATGLIVNASGGRQYINSGHLRLSDGYNIEWGGATNFLRGNNSNGDMALNATGDLTVDVVGDIILDADGAQVRFKDAGTEFFKVSNESGFVELQSPVADSDIKFTGIDGSSLITALTLDMSDAGTATFNSTVTSTGLASTTAGTSNFIAGVNAGNSIISGGNYNTFVGDEAGTAQTEGDNNVAIGYGAFKTSTTGYHSVVIGVNAGDAITTSGQNVLIGYDAGTTLTTGGDNTAVGDRSLKLATTAANTVALGTVALENLTTGTNNVAVGWGSLRANTTGSNNTAVGRDAGNDITTGVRNTLIGSLAGDAITTGIRNTTLGYLSGSSFDVGSYNVAIGDNALVTDTKGSTAVAIGYGALGTQNFATATNNYNVGIGYSAGTSTTTGILNTLIGGLGGDALTEGSYNVVIGAQALSADTKGSKNTAIGHSALEAQNFTTATSSYNTAIGSDAGKAITTGVQNTILGSSAGDSLTDADSNIAIGYSALTADTLGSASVAIGHSALGTQNFTTATSSYNTAVGFYAGLNITTGIQNTLVGGLAGDALTVGSTNVALGVSALGADTKGNSSVAIGSSALRLQNFTTATDAYNVAIGRAAGENVTTGIKNVIIGGNAGDANTVGFNNIAIGYDALGTNTASGANVAIGYEALKTYNNTTEASHFNTGVGTQAGKSVTTGIRNTLIGGETGDALTDANDNTAVGALALSGDTLGSKSTAIGRGALKTQNFTTATDSNNTAVGHSAGEFITTGTDNTIVGTLAGDAITTGNTNTVVGSEAFSANAAGDRNTAIGHRSLYVMNPSGNADVFNTALGYYSGANVSTGDKNTLIGALAGQNEATSIALQSGDNNVIIGYSAHPHASDGGSEIVMGKGTLGHANSTFTFGKNAGSDRVHNTFTSNATFTRVSDERYKKDIQTNTDCGLDFINELRTVTFKFKAKSEIPNTLPDYDAEKTTAEHTDKLYGLIAQEVKAALAKHNITDFGGHSEEESSGIQGVAQSMFIYPLIKAVQELSAENKALADRLAALEG